MVPPSGPLPTCTCTIKTTGATFTNVGLPASLGACCHVFGSTGWYQRNTHLEWRTITQKLDFSPNARNFGRRYEAILLAFQYEIAEPSVEPLPPPGAAWLREEQSYSYVIVLRPCPDKGRDVEGC